MPQPTTPHHRLRAAVFSPLSENGKADQVEDRLLQGIIAGILSDGDRLPRETELATSLGVATVTAREALVGLRARGLLTTRRGRDGGSFITVRPEDRLRLVAERLNHLSRVELRDTAIHYSAIASTAAGLAARFADANDVALLRSLLSGDSWMHATGNFLLELAALSQSARLTREYVRLHAEFGMLLLGAEHDDSLGGEVLGYCERIASAIEAGDGAQARELTDGYVAQLLDWLIREHSALAARSSP
ncbi:hypothetical protein BJH93_06390 [Kocuria polaris]|nr:hypothetical protein [Kocuria polaris]